MVNITRHVILRYLERVYGVEIDPDKLNSNPEFFLKIKKEIINIINKYISIIDHKNKNDYYIYFENKRYYFVLNENNVVTVKFTNKEEYENAK